MGMCHRIIVFSKNRIVGEVPRPEFDQERILSLAYQEYVRP
jgi:ribose transport system ATP-binding protein